MKIRIIVVLLITAVLLSSCFEVSTEITVEKDGSGLLKQRVLFSRMLVSQMEELAQSFGGEGSESSSKSMYDEEKLRSEASGYGDGVVFMKGSEITEEGKTGYEVTYSFRDVRDIRIVNNPASVLDMPAQGEDSQDPIRFDFRKKGAVSELTVIMPVDDTDTAEQDAVSQESSNESSEIDEQTMAMMKQMFSGMKFSYRINFGGKITETDADNVDGSSIILVEMDFDKLMENPDSFKNLEKLQGENSGEAVKAMKDVEGVKVEMKERVSVSFM